MDPDMPLKCCQKATKNEHRQTTNKCLKKLAASCASAASKMGAGRWGSPYSTAPQDKNTSQARQTDQGKEAKPG